jgi:chromosome segregation ATPase
MGFFTVGNLITLIIVALTLLLYRQFDRKNRSLERVRKYADKVMGELDVYAAEKGAAVKDFGIALEVERKSAAELMKRLQALTEQELAEKAAAIVRLEERLGDYDESLAELVGMTGRIQENLNRIRDESAFVEHVGKQVGDLRDKLNEMEKDLGGILVRFDRENTEALDKTAGGLFTALTAEIRNMEGRAEIVKRQVEEHRAAVDKVERDRAVNLNRDMAIIERSLKEAVEKAGARADKMEEAALGKLRDQAQDRINRLHAVWEEKLRAAQEAVKARMGEIQDQIKQFREEWKEGQGEMEARQKQQRESWDREARELESRLKEQREDWNGALADQREILDGEVRSLEALIGQQREDWNTALKTQREALNQEVLSLEGLIGQRQEDWSAVLKAQRDTLDREVRNLDALIGQQRDALDRQVRELELRVKGQQEDWDAVSSAQRESWAEDIRKMDSLIRQQQDEIKAAINRQREDLGEAAMKQQDEIKAAINRQREDLGAAVMKQQNEINGAISQELERLNAAAVRQRDEINGVIAQQRDEINNAIAQQRDAWAALSRDLEQQILDASAVRLDEYRRAQAEEINRLAGLADDAARLEEELRLSMQEAVNRVNADFSRFEQEAARGRDAVAAEFSGQVGALKHEMEAVGQELKSLKSEACENVSEKLKLFEDDFFTGLNKRSAEIDLRLAEWHDALDARLAEMAETAAVERRQAEIRLTEEMRKNLSDQGDRLTTELERLKNDAGAFEAGIREEMRGVDETRQSLQEQVKHDLEETRRMAEDSAKNEIGRYSLSLAETLKQNQRELEAQLQNIVVEVEAKSGEIGGFIEDSRRNMEEWQGSYLARTRELDASMDEARRRIREMVTESDERLASMRSSIDEIRKELIDETKIFDKAGELRQEMERRIEDLGGDLDRLDQRKNETAQLENQFDRIKRLGDDVNAKMTRFLSEKRRIEVMEADFNRLLQTSRAVEEKLVQVSSSDDTLQALQVQIRRLDDAVKETEEKYQRIERKNQILEETNDGIDRNFKILQETEERARRAGEELARIKGEMEILRSSIETLAADNGKALDTMDKLAVLDDTLSQIEKRIGEMQVARDWLARTETRLTELDKQAQTELRLIGSLLKRDGKQLPAGKGAPPPRDRDNIIKLHRQGWKKEEIAKTLDISIGEVELILEFHSSEHGDK